jgi:hypothetical protein
MQMYKYEERKKKRERKTTYKNWKYEFLRYRKRKKK